MVSSDVVTLTYLTQFTEVQLIPKLRKDLVALRKVMGRDRVSVTQLHTIYCSNLLLYYHQPHRLSGRTISHIEPK